MIKYLSPTSLRQWETDTEEWVFQRIVKATKFVQTIPMAIGGKFDDLIRQHLMEEFNLESTQKSGVDIKSDIVEEKGTWLFEEYKRSTSYHYLINILHKATDIDLIGRIQSRINGVPVLGITDLAFTLDNRHVLDWKTGGLQSSASPVMGYIGHPKFFFKENQGLVCNMEKPLAKRKPEWIDQLITYNLLVDAAPPFIGWIDQLTHRNGNIKVVSHREEIESEQVDGLRKRYVQAWSYIERGHYFPELSKEGSDAKVEDLMRQKSVFEGTTTNDLWYQKIMGRR